MYFPEEMKSSVIMGQFIGQIKLVTQSGIKGKDDCIDTISQLAYLTPWKPSDSVPLMQTDVDIWDDIHKQEEQSGLASYIV